MKTEKILATIAAFIVAATVLSAGAFAVLSAKAELEVETTAETTVGRCVPKSPHSHVFIDWYYLNDVVHARLCPVCCMMEIERHTRVPATKFTDEVCSVCHSRAQTWGEACRQHVMAYKMDWEYLETNGYDDPQNYYHVYRCARCDNELQYTCDHVAERQKCSFLDIYWSPERDGVHTKYQVCEFCNIVFCLEDSECPAAAYGTSCNMCNNPNKYNW